jgi:aspartate racemase
MSEFAERPLFPPDPAPAPWRAPGSALRAVGLLGGMSFESTLLYYRLINEGVRARLGGLHSAPLLMVSVDFEEIAALQRAGNWAAAGELLARGAETLHLAGADLVLICTNTMHKVAGEVQAAVPVPLLDVVDVVGAELSLMGARVAGLLGTSFTMEDGFYTRRLQHDHGVQALVPDAPDRALVHAVIFDELAQGHLSPESREDLRAIIAGLVADGAEAVILGCTELELLLGPADAEVPLLPTARLHARAAVEAMLEGVAA